MGHDVELVFLRGKKIAEYEELLEGIRYTIISETGDSLFSPVYQYITHIFAPSRDKRSRVDYNLLRNFHKYLKDKQIDYLICHDLLGGLAGFYAKKKLGIRYSVYVHERVGRHREPILGRIANSYERKVLKNAVAIFSGTEKIKKTVEDFYNLPAITNFPGMDSEGITSFDKKEDALITVSMWEPDRKPEKCLDIVSIVPGFILYVLGNFRTKEYQENFYKEIAMRGIADKVVVRHNLKESELRELYQRSKFSLRFGTNEYGVAMNTIESIQNCIPLIVNSLGSSDLISKYSCGLVVDEINPLEIKTFIERNNNAEAYESLQKNIKELAKNYSWRKHAMALLAPILPVSK